MWMDLSPKNVQSRLTSKAETNKLVHTVFAVAKVGARRLVVLSRRTTAAASLMDGPLTYLRLMCADGFDLQAVQPCVIYIDDVEQLTIKAKKKDAAPGAGVLRRVTSVDWGCNTPACHVC